VSYFNYLQRARLFGQLVIHKLVHKVIDIGMCRTGIVRTVTFGEYAALTSDRIPILALGPTSEKFRFNGSEGIISFNSRASA